MQFPILSKKALSCAVLLVFSLPVAWAAPQPESVDTRMNQQVSAPIPNVLAGNWSITKILPTQTITCWDEKQAQQLIGNKLSYKADSFGWNEHRLHNLGVTINIVEAQEFVEDNSGSSSYVDFPTLGIGSPSVQQIIIQHQDVVVAGITDQGGEGIPGENVLVKDRNTLIFSQCGVWFEAQRQKK